MSDTASKLRALLPHWVEHNASHLEAFRQWQQQAGAAGLTAVAAELKQTVLAAEHLDAALRRAASVVAGEP